MPERSRPRCGSHRHRGQQPHGVAVARRRIRTQREFRAGIFGVDSHAARSVSGLANAMKCQPCRRNKRAPARGTPAGRPAAADDRNVGILGSLMAPSRALFIRRCPFQAPTIRTYPCLLGVRLSERRSRCRSLVPWRPLDDGSQIYRRSAKDRCGTHPSPSASPSACVVASRRDCCACLGLPWERFDIAPRTADGLAADR